MIQILGCFLLVFDLVFLIQLPLLRKRVMLNRIKIGVTALSFHRTTTSLITNVLKTMGFEVEQVFSRHQENFEKLKTGEVDMLSSAWLPSSHGIYKSNVEEVMPLIELGLHYEPYA